MTGGRISRTVGLVTMSIVAFDADEGTVGAAVTSCAIAAARRVLHVRPGVGAAVAQGASEIPWSEDILDAVGSRVSLAEALARFLRDDNQLAVVGFGGGVAVHTGSGCVPHAGHVVGGPVACQVNTAALADAADRMLGAFHTASGPLAERLVAALAASGGDTRGQQAAGVIVAGAGPLRGHPDEPHIDLRVDDHRAPVDELGRLLSLHRAHCTMRLLSGDDSDQKITVLEGLLREHANDPHLLRALQRARTAARSTP
jgi:uncharacterized Ntn-hydrolase superfamily protein